MSFAGAFKLNPSVTEEELAKWELKKRFGPIDGLWWRLMPGEVVEVPWPNGKLVVTPEHPSWDWTLSATLQEIYSADPNDHYRPWLEEHVGKQGWDWQWRIRVGTSMYSPGYEHLFDDRVEVKFRKSKAKFATIFSLMYNK